jgi:glutaredoxin 3
MRDQLEWAGAEFVEHDVEADAAARERLFALTGAGTMVPVLVEDGVVAKVGWEGRGCYVGPR